ncbi:MAG: two-component system response regulator, partial [Ignavibacteriae bacterium]
DIIVTDITIPKVDGKTLIYHLSSSDELCHIPVLVISTICDGTEKIELLQSGTHDFLIEPTNPEELTINIKTSLNRSA